MNIGSRTCAISTARVGRDSAIGEDVFETRIIEPGEMASKSVRHGGALEQARRVHDLFVADYSWRSGAVVVECLSRPWRF